MISPDLPITKSSDDKLNRQSFAESLAHVLLQSSFPTSFTVGLYGAWGSGKTSLLNMVIEQVESKDHDVVVLEPDAINIRRGYTACCCFAPVCVSGKLWR